MYRLTDDLALVQTVDFITPVVNDPYDFGRIAAANSLSDVYAMGGRPLTAMNLVCFPIKDMDKAILKEILRGGLSAIHEAGAVLAGGHSVEDPEIKYGLSVTGVIHPDKVLANSGVKPGDALVLTKPLGTGVLATAIKAGLISEAAQRRAVETMGTLNRRAAEIMSGYPVNGCTDVTGFGLLGHALEMAKASKVRIAVFSQNVPLLPEALDAVGMGLVPGGSFSNRNYCSHQLVGADRIDPMLLDILSDAQTSGGLLISLPEPLAESFLAELKAGGVADAAIVGRAASTDKPVVELS